MKDAVNKFLDKSNRFTGEKLCLTRSSQGFFDSENKVEILNIISEISNTYNIDNKYHFDYALNEAPDYYFIESFYMSLFLKYMKFGNVTDGIRKIGLEEYKKIVKEYNQKLIIAGKAGKLLSPKEILEYKNGDKSNSSNEILDKYLNLINEAEESKKDYDENDGNR